MARSSAGTAISFISGNNTDLRVDVNRFLPDGVTPNPNAVRLYVEDDIGGAQWRNHRTEQRLQVAYPHDFQKQRGWRRWLGPTRDAVLGYSTTLFKRRVRWSVTLRPAPRCAPCPGEKSAAGRSRL